MLDIFSTLNNNFKLSLVEKTLSSLSNSDQDSAQSILYLNSHQPLTAKS